VIPIDGVAAALATLAVQIAPPAELGWADHGESSASVEIDVIY